MSWDGDSWETEAEEFFETDASNYAAERLLYDAAGNLTYDGEYQYTFDAWNRLVKVQRAWRDANGALQTGSVVALIAYDGQGRRIQKEIQNSADWTATYHYYYSRGWQVLEERNGSGEVLRQYVWGARYVDNPVQIGINTDPSDSTEGPGENQCLVEDFYWPVQDANFNVLGLVASDGTLHERYEYTPYGERTVYKRAGSADEKTSAPLYESQRVEVASVRQPYGLCDLGHQGLFFDKEFGQYYNRRRQYLPRAARFLNRDPVGYANGMSLYEYVGARPVNMVDPTGLLEREDPTTNFGHEFDMIILTDPNAKLAFERDLQYAAEVRAGEAGGGTTKEDIFKQVRTTEEFVKAAKERYEQVNQGKTEKRCLRIMVVGHGTSTSGPHVGEGRPHVPTESEDLLPYPPDPDPGRMIRKSEAEKRAAMDKAIKETAAGTPMGQLKGVVDDVTFSNCNIASGEGGANLDTYAKELDMNITAPTRMGTTKVTDNGDITFTPSGVTSGKPSDYIHRSRRPTPDEKK